jgi:aminoglycoside phosphotransferase (APT) family kinase protein
MANEIEEALARLAPKLGGGAVTDLQRLSGGASAETWAFALEGPGGRREMILRRRPGPPPDEETSRSVTITTEAALIRAAAEAGAPVAPLIWLARPEDGLGEAHITARVPGETLGRKIVADPRFEAVRPRLARQCGEILASIHRAKPDAELKSVDFLDELARYDLVYRQSGAERPILELALQHLKQHAPPPIAPVLLHGDFRNGNLIVDPEKGVAAVLDWELSHYGDPAEDLSWICVNSWRFGRSDRPVGGFGDYRELLDGYAAAGGAEIPLSRVRAWQALGSLKWGVMCLMMYMSYATGVEPSVERPMIGRRVSETEIDLVKLLEAGL